MLEMLAPALLEGDCMKSKEEEGVPSDDGILLCKKSKPEGWSDDDGILLCGLGVPLPPLRFSSPNMRTSSSFLLGARMAESSSSLGARERPVSLEEAMQNAAPFLERAAARTARLLRLPFSL